MSIRLRIAVLSGLLTVILLLGVGAGVYFTLEHSLTAATKSRLSNVFGTIQGEMKPQLYFDPTLGWRIQWVLPDPDPIASPGLYIQAIYPDGSIVPNSPTADLNGHSLVVPDDVRQKNLRTLRDYYTTTYDSVPIYVLSAPLFNNNGEVIAAVQVAEPLSPMLRTLDKLRLLLLLGAAVGLVAAVAGAYFLAGRSLNPLTKITTTAREIGHSADLSRRIDEPRTHDEVEQLSETFNQMLDRLEETFAAERRFVSDASHELRTPLTALRGNSEILLKQVSSGRIELDDLQDGLTDIRDEAERMGRLVQNLLTLARADVGWRPELGLVHLDQLVVDSARLAESLAGNHVLIPGIVGEIDVLGNSDQLKQLILILLDNAFTYTPEGGRVELRAERVDGDPVITVRDSGPGIPPEQIERIFDRFYRGEFARVHGTSGAGLGLAIAHWIVDCHEGTISAASGPEGGTTVTVHLRPYEGDAAGEERPRSLAPEAIATAE